MQTELSRRSLFKGAGAVAAGCALGSALPSHTPKAFAETNNSTMNATQTWGYCRMCMKSGCSTVVTQKDGVVVDVSGNPAGQNAGTLCPKGKAAVMHMYNPHRIKSPMKRTNPEKALDNDPGWIEISWEEAFDIVGAKLKEIHDNDPRELIINTGFGMMDMFHTVGPFIAASFGTPNWIQSNGPLCSVHYAAQMIQSCFPAVGADYIYADYVISMGRGGGGNFAVGNGCSMGLADALERGMKYIVVDPRCSIEASKGEWVPIRPGGDYAFVLGMLNVMFYEIQKYDLDFLKNRTNAPYLVNENGDFVRGPHGKPQMWDKAEEIAKEFDQEFIDPALEGEFEVDGVPCQPGFQLVRESCSEYTPEWAEQICTIPADTIRRLANEFVEHARIGSTIVIDNVEFPYRPVVLMSSRGTMNHQDGAQADLAIKLINELVGAMDVPGANHACGYGKLLKPNEDGVVTPAREARGECEFTYPPVHFDLAEYFPYRHSIPFMAFRSIQDPEKYGLEIRPKMLLCMGGNTINGSVEPEMIAEGVKKIPFVATVCYHMDEIAQLSDVLLPEHAMLERTCINTVAGISLSFSERNAGVIDTQFREGVKPIYNTKHCHEILFELWKRAGALPALYGILNNACKLGEGGSVKLAPEYQLDPTGFYAIEDIWDRALKSFYGPDKGMDYLKEHGQIENRLSRAESYNYYHFPGSETRYQFYIWEHLNNGRKIRQGIEKFSAPDLGLTEEIIALNYSAVPQWFETELLKKNDEYPFYGFNFKTTASMFRLGAADQISWLAEWSDKYDNQYNTIMINASKAAELDIQTGDEVIVESCYGSTSGKAYVTQLVHPESIGIGGATGRLTPKLGESLASRIHYNKLLGAPLGSFNVIDGGVDNAVRLKINKIS